MWLQIINTAIRKEISPKTILKSILFIGLAATAGFIISNLKLVGLGIPIGLAGLIIFSLLYSRNPKLGIYAIVVMGFLIPILSRYFPVAPFGLSIDAFLIISFLVLLFKRWKVFTLKPAFNELSLIWTIWMVFILVMIINPQAKSVTAWFYAMRGFALYPFLMIPLAFIAFDSKKDFERVFTLIFVLEIIGTLWAMKQLYIGVSATEQAWLNAGAASTHVLFGKLRAFSYFSDAAQFGASQAHIGFIALVFGFGEPKFRKKLFYFFTAILLFYGMIISGSRGPLVIPALSGMVWLVLAKRFTLFFSGVFVGALLFSILSFTSIGQSNYFVQRIRTALNPSEDPSFIVRKEREKQLSGYLANKPIGGGVGSAGFWGKRFSPGTFLAEIGTDGHYTRVWMETGIIGLWLYLFLFAWLALRVLSKAFQLKNDELRLKIGGLAAVFVGLAVASYTNGLIIQIPTGPIVYLSLVFIFRSVEWDKEAPNEKKLTKTAF